MRGDKMIDVDNGINNIILREMRRNINRASDRLSGLINSYGRPDNLKYPRIREMNWDSYLESIEAVRRLQGTLTE